MCNINEKVPEEVQEITGYKVVVKRESIDNTAKYYGMFSGTLVEIGPVKSKVEQTRSKDHCIVKDLKYSNFDKSDQLYNKNMIGRTSCFKNKEAAKSLMKSLEHRLAMYHNSFQIVYLEIVEIVLKNGLMAGTAYNIDGVDKDEVTYAGKEVVSFEEV